MPRATIRVTKHGPACPCIACAELMVCARRIAARNPRVRIADLEGAYQRFVYYALHGREKSGLWDQPPSDMTVGASE